MIECYPEEPEEAEEAEEAKAPAEPKKMSLYDEYQAQNLAKIAAGRARGSTKPEVPRPTTIAEMHAEFPAYTVLENKRLLQWRREAYPGGIHEDADFHALIKRFSYKHWSSTAGGKPCIVCMPPPDAYSPVLDSWADKMLCETMDWGAPDTPTARAKLATLAQKLDGAVVGQALEFRAAIAAEVPKVGEDPRLAGLRATILSTPPPAGPLRDEWQDEWYEAQLMLLCVRYDIERDDIRGMDEVNILRYEEDIRYGAVDPTPPNVLQRRRWKEERAQRPSRAIEIYKPMNPAEYRNKVTGGYMVQTFGRPNQFL
jgi:hypothetical protein